ncbi:cell division protein ZipA [bacterium BMS3Bbin12]|nr:cell division protein ZipA [bacterium BMS3Abin12]GBE47682.1 cell division protein ZipA [bacterium BMS3Bbin12]GBE49966.1 cell division protein ZipA [bacterium BMS3Bbin13]HDK03514.1 cell division protein ZipA [Gammaproteobacteria bacterium]
MDTLRLVLLILGALMLLGVYLWDRLRRSRTAQTTRRPASPVQPEPEPEAVAEELAGLGALIAEDRAGACAPCAAEPAVRPAGPATRDPAPAAESKLVVLYVAAPAGARFAGADLVRAFEEEGLEYGAMRIYHRRDPAVGGATLFSVANMLEPGCFEPQQMNEFTTSGLVLLQQLPGPRPGPEAFQAMLETARRLADRFGGELRDERHNPLTHRRMETLRAEVMEHERRRHLPGGGA